MRLALRTDLINRGASCLAICTALTLGAQTAQARPPQFDALADPNGAIGPNFVGRQATAQAAPDDDSQIAANTSNPTIDAAFVNDISLDHQMLSRQRGGAVGMLMVAATPQQMRSGGDQVTLWDEIAPPSPLPVPIDAARAAQGSVATHQRN